MYSILLNFNISVSENSLVYKNRNKKRLNTECATKISAYRNTWFQHDLNIQNICQFIAYHIMLRPRQDFIRNELNITQHTAVDSASFCRELCGAIIRS